MRGEGFPKNKMVLPLDVETIDTDIRCERDDEGIHFNITQRVRHHSPTGMEWGYAGSGPADFALNILDRFLPAGTDGWEGTPCWDKNIVSRMAWSLHVSRMAWSLHQDFKVAFVAALPYEGGVISGARIRAWIVAMTEPGFAVFGAARDEQGREYEWLHDDGYDTLAMAEAEAEILTNTTSDPDLVGFAARRVVNVR